MVTKRALCEAFYDLSVVTDELKSDLSILENKISFLEAQMRIAERKIKTLQTPPKKEDKLEQEISSKKLAAKAKKQPRDKNGKFIKKK